MELCENYFPVFLFGIHTYVYKEKEQDHRSVNHNPSSDLLALDLYQLELISL